MSRLSLILIPLTRGLLLWFLSRPAHWKLDNELTENQDDPDPVDRIELIDWRLALDLTDLPDTWLDEEAAVDENKWELFSTFQSATIETWFYWVVGDWLCQGVSWHGWWNRFSVRSRSCLPAIVILDPLYLGIANNAAQRQLATANSLKREMSKNILCPFSIKYHLGNVINVLATWLYFWQFFINVNRADKWSPQHNVTYW